MWKRILVLDGRTLDAGPGLGGSFQACAHHLAVDHPTEVVVTNLVLEQCLEGVRPVLIGVALPFVGGEAAVDRLPTAVAYPVVDWVSKHRGGEGVIGVVARR